jgi:ATP-dependent Clp protease adaptor protein ClpS
MANQQQDGNLLEIEKTKLRPPPLYKVLLLNDDYTPMDFVVIVLQTVFAMSREKATQVMLQVHREGMGVCGTYTREVADAKVRQVTDLARKHQHPLQCTMEEV